jgi:Fe-S-cluster-containing hydrogenase component 2
MNLVKSNFLLFSPDRCTGCKSCEMVCSLQKTGSECNRQESFIRVKTHPYLYSSLISVSVGCSCHDGEELCVKACSQDAIVFLEKTDAPATLKNREWLPGSIVSEAETV